MVASEHAVDKQDIHIAGKGTKGRQGKFIIKPKTTLLCLFN